MDGCTSVVVKNDNKVGHDYEVNQAIGAMLKNRGMPRHYRRILAHVQH